MQIRRMTLALALAPFLLVGISIGCGIAEKGPEAYKAPPVVVMANAPTPDSAEIIGIKLQTIRTKLQESCLEILTMFQEAELHAATASKMGIVDDSVARSLYRNLDLSSKSLATNCEPSLRELYGRYPQLQRIHGRALYFWEHKKFPPRLDTKTPAKSSRG